MKKQTLLVVASLLLISFIFGSCATDENTIKGTIKYKSQIDNKEYVKEGMLVYLMEQGQTNISDAYKQTTTDKNGFYEFTLVENGTYYVYAEYTENNYTYKGSSENVQVKGKDVKTIDLLLK